MRGRGLSARPLSPRRGRLGAARRPRWDKAPDEAGDATRPRRRLWAPGALHGSDAAAGPAARPPPAAPCRQTPAAAGRRGLASFPHRSPHLSPFAPHRFHTKSPAGLAWISTSSRPRSSALWSAPRTLPLGLFAQRIKVQFNVTGFLGLKCTKTSPCALCSFPFLILSTPLLLTQY